MRILLAGPYDTKGRYEGGISYIVNSIVLNTQSNKDFYIEKFDTCCVQRPLNNQGKISLSNIKNTICIIKKLKKWDEGIDVVYYNTSYGIPMFKDLLAIKLSGCRRNAKVLLHIHFADAEKILPSNKIIKAITMRLLQNNIDHLVFLSKNTQEAFVNMGIAREKTSVIYNFHNIKMNAEEVAVKKEKHIDYKKMELLFIGSIDERKGILDLLNALKNVKSDYHLTICGKPVDERIEMKLDQTIQSFPRGQIDIKGYVTGQEKVNVLKNADIMILPSYGEGFPIVLLEGIAAANALITTNVGAIPEVFDGNNGVIIEPGDVDSLAKAIDYLNDSHTWATTIDFNYEQSKKFHVNNFVEQMKFVCKKILV